LRLRIDRKHRTCQIFEVMYIRSP